MRKTDDNLVMMNALFVTALVTSNVVAAKLCHTGLNLFGVDLMLPGAAICYACTFLFTDVISEIWGREKASKSVLYGFVCQLFASALILVTEKLPAEMPEMQAAYNKLLGMNLVFVFASLTAYIVAQLWDVWVFHKIREWYLKKNGTSATARWIWNNASTMSSQILDTMIFIGIAFGFGFGWLWKREMWPVLAATALGQYLFKVMLAILDTPFFYLLTRKSEPKQ